VPGFGCFLAFVGNRLSFLILPSVVARTAKGAHRPFGGVANGGLSRQPSLLLSIQPLLRVHPGFCSTMANVFGRCLSGKLFTSFSRPRYDVKRSAGVYVVSPAGSFALFYAANPCGPRASSPARGSRVPR